MVHLVQIGADAAAAEHAHALSVKTGSGQGRITGVFQCFPAAFKKHTLLWIYFFRLAPGVAEERGVKHFRIAEAVEGPHVGGILQKLPADAGFSEGFPVRERSR